MPRLHPCRMALLLALTPTLTAAGPAPETIEVTASPSSAEIPVDGPVSVITAADIARSGARTLDDLLERLPAMGSQGVNGNQNQGGYGEAFADLRNLNFDRTLVLVDGRRMVVSGIRTDEAVDLDSLPLALVDHVEVLKDGAQPRYGPDAVAGAINIVLKNDGHGLHVSTYDGISSSGDSATTAFSASGGLAGHGIRVALGISLSDKRAVPQADRAWASGPVAEASFLPAGGIATTLGSVASANGHALAPGIDAQSLGGGRFRPFNPATDDYRFAASQDLQGSLQRASGVLKADADLTDDLGIFLQVLGSVRQAVDVSPGAMIGLDGTIKHPQGFVVPAGNPYNPFGQPVTLARSLVAAGGMETVTTGDTVRVVTGVDGDLGDAHWSLSYDHGESRSVFATGNAVDLTQALASVDAGKDWFGPGLPSFSSLAPASLAGVLYTDRARATYREDVLQASIRDDLAVLPAGALRANAGMEARWESGATTVSPETLAGDQAGPDEAPTSGGYATRDVFLDLTAPLLRRLTATASARESATDRYGSFPTFATGLSYIPIGGITLRGTVGLARRPPAISEAFGGITAELLPVTDPCDGAAGLLADPTVAGNCRRQGLASAFHQASPLIDVAAGGNPHLRPEASTNQTIGAVIAPAALPGWHLAVDGWRYRIADAIDSLADTDPDVIPDNCYRSAGLSSPLCGLITRVAGGPSQGQISRILARDMNVGTIRTSGVDLDLAAMRRVPGLGNFSLDGQATWLADYGIRETGQPGFSQYAGRFPALVGVGLYARWRGRLEATWDNGPWSLRWTGRFTSGGHVLGDDGPYTHAGAVLYQDISLTRQIGRFAIMAGVDNLADVTPPRLIDGISNTSTNTYDVVGPFAWSRLVAVF